MDSGGGNGISNVGVETDRLTPFFELLLEQKIDFENDPNQEMVGLNSNGNVAIGTVTGNVNATSANDDAITMSDDIAAMAAMNELFGQNVLDSINVDSPRPNDGYVNDDLLQDQTIRISNALSTGRVLCNEKLYTERIIVSVNVPVVITNETDDNDQSQAAPEINQTILPVHSSSTTIGTEGPVLVDISSNDDDEDQSTPDPLPNHPLLLEHAYAAKANANAENTSIPVSLDNCIADQTHVFDANDTESETGSIGYSRERCRIRSYCDVNGDSFNNGVIHFVKRSIKSENEGFVASQNQVDCLSPKKFRIDEKSIQCFFGESRRCWTGNGRIQAYEIDGSSGPSYTMMESPKLQDLQNEWDAKKAEIQALTTQYDHFTVLQRQGKSVTHKKHRVKEKITFAELEKAGIEKDMENEQLHQQVRSLIGQVDYLHRQLSDGGLTSAL